MVSHKSKPFFKKSSFMVIVIMVLEFFMLNYCVTALPTVPYHVDDRWTYLEKTGEPIKINQGDILPGNDWTYECYLSDNYQYHVYLIGPWTDVSDPDTDYDVFVYDKYGDLISTHTQSAALDEQVSNDDNNWYFHPDISGKYSFRVKNDLKESQNDKEATFVIIQHIESNKIYSKRLYGRDEHDRPVLYTSMSYEFVIENENFEVYVEVPDTLDMYEARFYPMTYIDKEFGKRVSGALIPWEDGLYGELFGETTKGKSLHQLEGDLGVRKGGRSSEIIPYDPKEHGDIKFIVGGFNTTAEGFRNPDAFASCESFGQDMYMEYENTGETLYHLVLIAEYGIGTVNFYIKTDFEPPNLTLIDPPSEAYSKDSTSIFVSVNDTSTIKNVTLNYTTDGGKTWNKNNMLLTSDGLYRTIIPPLFPANKVEYVIKAIDEVDNEAEINGQYTLLGEPPKPPESTTISCYLDKEKVKINREIIVTGLVTPNVADINVNVRFVSSSNSHSERVLTDSNGEFTCSYSTSEIGDWNVLAEVVPQEDYAQSQSGLLEFSVVPLTLIDKTFVLLQATYTRVSTPPFLYVTYVVISISGILVVYRVIIPNINRSSEKNPPAEKTD